MARSAGAKPAIQKRRRAAKPARAAPKNQPPEGVLQLNGAAVSLPLEWFILPLRQAIAKAIRPPTAGTRRKQRVVEMPIPLSAFVHFIRNFETGEVENWNGWTARRRR